MDFCRYDKFESIKIIYMSPGQNSTHFGIFILLTKAEYFFPAQQIQVKHGVILWK